MFEPFLLEARASLAPRATHLAMLFISAEMIMKLLTLGIIRTIGDLTLVLDSMADWCDPDLYEGYELPRPDSDGEIWTIKIGLILPNIYFVELGHPASYFPQVVSSGRSGGAA